MTEEAKYLIYALYNDQSPRLYIGMSKRGLRRPISHGLPSNMKRSGHRPATQWISKYRALGVDYKIAVLETLPSVEALPDAEIFHIAYFRFLGIPLLNCTDGGDGLLNPSPETRAKIAAKLRGGKMSAESRAKMSAAGMGRIVSDEARASLRAAAARRAPETWERQIAACRTPEYRAKMSEIVTGRRYSLSGKAKASMSVAALNRSCEAKRNVAESHRTPEFRLKMSRLKSGLTYSAESRAKMSAAAQKPERAAAIAAQNDAKYGDHRGAWRRRGVDGTVIKEWRSVFGLTRRAAAIFLGVDETALYRFEKNE